ncbi:putative N-acetylmuramoyl-L-alanine amidase [Oenococcus oeni]|uniref:peptidoglycan recognition protein family protein n=1 Tax=Oenococcus oeni TaxID=1247 RepID=UPI0010B02D8E|nr:peptidoglycan recognition family protein [Oenococcus oeni]SYW02328.1 putative N-acetylmuramoyl-L-alanine amidase [Oenococcus oeni]
MKGMKLLFCLLTAILATFFFINGKAKADTPNNSVLRYIRDGVKNKGWKPAAEQNWLSKSTMLPKNNYRYGKARPEGIVIHETANPRSTITSEITYMYKNWRTAFVHNFVDGNSLIGVADTDYQCWGAGAIANPRFIQIEQVEVHSKDEFAREQLNAAKFAADQLNHYHLGAASQRKTIWTHDDVSKYLGGSNHTDPINYWNNSAKDWFSGIYTINDFIWLVNQIKNNTLTK